MLEDLPFVIIFLDQDLGTFRVENGASGIGGGDEGFGGRADAMEARHTG